MSGFVSRWKNDASNAMEDIYGSIMLGDDAGQADRLVVILQPPPAIFLGRSFGKRMWNTLGVCFCNIQNRAYVQQVEEGSPADLQGVSVKDCVQYAAVLAKEWQNPLTSDLEDISKQALERESSGQRISYLDLRRILERGMENTQTSFLSPPSVPTTISVGHSSSGANRDTDLATPRPLVLVLRRTKQRSTFSRSFNIWPRFRLDDECDVATQIIVNLASSSTDAHKQGSVEASTIRDMIQTCHGIAFLRQNKLALGLSFHGGSGIILAKLEDGSWSPPSAIGTFGMGVALGVGACVEHTLIVMQTKQACEHFMRGASFQIGVGLGAALFGIGREAMGSANMSGALCGSTHILEFTNEDEYDTANVQSSKNSNDTEQVSNAMIHGVTPMMAYAMSEGLYFGVSLGGTKIHTRHDVNGRTYQFLATSSQNDISPQEILQAKVPMPLEARKLVASLIATEFQHELQHLPKIQSLVKKNCWHFLSPSLEKDKLESSKVDAVREFFFGGVAVIQEPKEKPRTLWMYLPGMDASLEIGFISSLSERKCSLKQPTRAHINNISDALSTASEDLTLDSTLIDNNLILHGGYGGTGIIGSEPTMRVELSRKHSMALTDITWVEIKGNVLSIRSSRDKRLIFRLSSPDLAQLVFNGIVLLIEDTCAKFGTRGGSGKSLPNKSPKRKNASRKSKSGIPQSLEHDGFSSSEDENFEEDEEDSRDESLQLPAGWKSWSKIAGRSYLKKQAISEEGCPQYVHGQLLVRDICKNAHLPLSLPLVRVLLLDSSSPVIQQWEKKSGNTGYEKTPWTFPPATPREMDQYQSEHQLIASGSMCGAHRTISYALNSSRLSETHIVDFDDSERIAFSVNERMPKRGFSVKVKVIIRSFQNECDATISAELRPVGKNMSNPTTVHKAFLLVLDELGDRYGTLTAKGLLGQFLRVVANLPKDNLPATKFPESTSSYPNHRSPGEEKKQDSASRAIDGVVKLEDMLKNNTESSSRVLNSMDSSTKSGFNESRPKDISKQNGKYKQHPSSQTNNKKVVKDEPLTSTNDPVMIEVKPLPKIPIQLMPSPREEDEDKEAKKKEKKMKDKKKKDAVRKEMSSSNLGMKTSSSWSKKRKPKVTKL